MPGTFLDLVIDAAVNDFAPAPLMALLKHPLCRIGLAPFDIRRFGRALEIIAFRSPYLGRGLEGVAAALDHAERAKLDKERQHDAVRRLWDEDWAGARDLVKRLAAAFEPLASLYRDNTKRPLKAFATAHAETAERLAAVPEATDTIVDASANPLWQGEAGEAANTFFVGLLSDEMPGIEIRSADYADLYRSLLARENVRERTPVHPRVSIWGPFEARLQQPDVLILGSLNEGTWPEAADPGAWLNRPMREELGLPSPEVEIGRAAHDFISLLGAERVYLTRSQKIKGVPTVPSRWLMRINALLDGLEIPDALESAKPWLGWARARDMIEDSRRRRISAPEPRPAAGLRPRRMSVTRVEQWIKNPYAIFAGQILKLEPCPRSASRPTRACAARSCTRCSRSSPPRIPIRCPAISRRRSKRSRKTSWRTTPDIRASPRSGCRVSNAFSRGSRRRRPNGARMSRALSAETTGTLVIAAPRGPFTLTARADRIDDTGAGLIITDYKTGVAPNTRAVLSNRSPQLPLEAAIALGETGFPGLAGRPVMALRYIRASGGEPPGEETSIKSDDVAALGRSARAGLAKLVALYDDEARPIAPSAAPGSATTTTTMLIWRASRNGRRTSTRRSAHEPGDLGQGYRRRAQGDRPRASRAADPTSSVWVNANAGTGKTHVLTMRVLRLLLAGTEPARILCLTYTKAAAAEMSKRVFDRLAGWVTATDEDLSEALSRLTGTNADNATLARARTLFTRAIETPGGLKVQTIHAFAERLLQRFPLEAGVPPGFKILDDVKKRELVARAINETLEEATSAPAKPLGRALETAIRYASDANFDELLVEDHRRAHMADRRQPARTGSRRR